MKPGQIGSSSPAIVVRDVVVVGAAMIAGTAPPSKTHVPGYIRGFDVRTGARIWTFKTIPQPGEFGHETWEGDSWKYTGNTGAWAPLAADEELGYVYIPVEAPTGDFYGGHRLGDNLFSDSLVCLDAKTGKRVWHFQLVHHDIWDWEPSSPPMLADITVGGTTIKAVAQVTKHAFTFVFDRVTGKPVWPIEERPVPQTDVPGERTSPTQPFPTRPAPYDRQGVTIDDLIDFTPELKAEAIAIFNQYKTSTNLFLPPIVAGTDGKLASLWLPHHTGGGNWPGGALRSGDGDHVRVLRHQRRRRGGSEGRSETHGHGVRGRVGRASRRPQRRRADRRAPRRRRERPPSQLRAARLAAGPATVGPHHRHRPQHGRPRLDDRQR